jgi:hypothetical protein
MLVEIEQNCVDNICKGVAPCVTNEPRGGTQQVRGCHLQLVAKAAAGARCERLDELLADLQSGVNV